MHSLKKLFFTVVETYRLVVFSTFIIFLMLRRELLEPSYRLVFNKNNMLQKIILILIWSFIISCAGPPPPGHRRTSGLYPTKIILKNAKSQYVRLNDEAPYYLIADAPNISQADTFYLCDLGRNLFALKARDQYVSIFLPSENQAILRQEYIDLWEKLTLEKQEDLIGFKACNDLYLQPTSDNIVAASSATLTDSCLFQMIEL